MVQGLADFNRRWTAIPKLVRKAAIETLETNANELVTAMRSVLPLQEIEVAWTWGKPPKGSMAIGKIAGGERGQAITVYATADDFNPAWFEFGTGPRYAKAGRYSGQIPASPFFWPIYRAKRKRLKARMTRNVNKAIRSA